ncbi:hypothetical protein TCON_1777 [Astathelohania contejeani]|uniref:USP domain-containing protein n=1 Tax=Astathelohania contejeani TaxID=164912 RepID=A0ABQ7HXX5_9MICR|nr:hypothetical protein TCON_1777 [Thelohania contejeani]
MLIIVIISVGLSVSIFKIKKKKNSNINNSVDMNNPYNSNAKSDTLAATFEYEIDKKDYCPPNGLPNPYDNICYYNAFMQCFVSSYYFKKYINQNLNGRLFKKLKNFINLMYQKAKIEVNQSIDIIRCVKNISNKRYYLGKSGENSGNFYRSFLTQLENEENADLDESIGKICKTKCYKKYNTKNGFSFVSDYDQYILILFVYNDNQFRSLLNLIFENKSIECLNIENKPVESFYYKGYDKYYIFSDIFIIEINIFYREGCSDVIKGIFDSKKVITINNIEYSLFGVVLTCYYSLNPPSGHAVAYAKRNGSWYYFDDNRNVIKKKDNYDLMLKKNNDSLTFFFERINDRNN